MLKRKTNSGFTDLTTYKRQGGNGWVNITTAKRWNGNAWINLLADAPSSDDGNVKVYNLISSQNYWNGGGKDNQFPKELIQGSYGGSSSIRRCLMLFDSKIAADLQGKTITKVELYLYRNNTTHGVSGGANVKVKTHNYSAIPTSWNGADTGNADAGTPTLKRGEGKWITLLNSVGEGLRDGMIKGLCLDADSSTSMSDYIRCTASKTQLRITTR